MIETFCINLYKCSRSSSLKKIIKEKITFADNLFTPIPSVLMSFTCHSFFSRKEIEVFDESIPRFFNGNQTVQGPKDCFSANCSKSFKRFQTMNKGLIKLNDW